MYFPGPNKWLKYKTKYLPNKYETLGSIPNKEKIKFKLTTKQVKSKIKSLLATVNSEIDVQVCDKDAQGFSGDPGTIFPSHPTPIVEHPPGLKDALKARFLQSLGLAAKRRTGVTPA